MRKEYVNRWDAKLVNPAVTAGEWEARKGVLSSLFQSLPVAPIIQAIFVLTSILHRV